MISIKLFLTSWQKTWRVLYKSYILPQNKRRFGYAHHTSNVAIPATIAGIENVYLDEFVSIGANSILFAPIRKIHIKKCSYSGPRLYIGTGDHLIKAGYFSRLIDIDKKIELGGGKS